MKINLLLNLVISLLIFTFFLVLAFIFYKSEIYAGFSRFYYYKKYYFIIFFFIVLYSSSFLFSKKIKIFLILSFFTISTAIYSFEIYLHVLDLKKPNIWNEYKDRVKKDSDWVLPFTPKGSTNLINYSKLKYLPLSGISKRNTLHCNENGYWATYKSDRYGFNNNDNVWDKQIDITLLGDSYTKGACVNPQDNISGNLQKSGLNVLNLGQGGNGPLTELAILKEYVQLIKTKKILWIYSNNDLDDLESEKQGTLTRYITSDKNHNLHKRQSEIDKIYLDYQKRYNSKSQFNFMSILKLLKFRMILIERRLTNKYEHNINKYNFLINQDLKNILSIAKDITEKNNQDFYFIYLPGMENFYPKRYADTYKKVNDLKPKVFKVVEDLEINIIDLEKHLKNEKPTDMFPKRGHYNSKGYQLIAEGIFNNIK